MAAILSDADFLGLVRERAALTKSLESEFNGPSAPHLDAVNNLRNKLVAKYNIDVRELNDMVAKQLPDYGLAAAGRQHEQGTVSRVALGASNLLAPLQIPQQVLFHGLSAIVKEAQALQGEGPLWKRLSDAAAASADEMTKVPIEGLLRAPAASVSNVPGMERIGNMKYFSDLLREWGVKNDTAVRIGGFAGDLILDPLLFGDYVKGLGLAARGLGAIEGGKALIGAGERMTAAMSPAGVAKLITPPRVQRGMTEFVNTLLNWSPEILGRDGIWTWKGRQSLGELFLSEGRNPALPTKNVFTGGAGSPAEFGRSLAKGRATADDVINYVNSSLENLYSIFGKDRVKEWAKGIQSTLTRVGKVPDRLDGYPSALRDQIMALAGETADNMGVLQNDLAQRILESRGFGLAGQSVSSSDRVLADTFGQEVRNISGAMPPSESNIFRVNRDRVTQLAVDTGFPEEIAQRAYDEVTGTLIALDTELGFHYSLYGPMKETLYEGVGRLGGTADDAAQVWQNAIRDALDGKDPTKTPLSFLEDAGVDPRNIPNVGDILPGAGGALDLGSYFQSLRDGHLRRIYAISQTPDSFSAFIRGLRSGNAVPSSIIESEHYGPLFRDALHKQGIDAGVADLIQNYFDNISPSLPQERGFIVPQQNIARHLVEQGVSPEDAKVAIGELIKAANPYMADMIDELKRVRAAREGVAMSHSAAPTTGKAAVSARTLGYETDPKLQALDTQMMELLGRLQGDPGAAVMETTRGLANTYPTSQFLNDVWNVGRRLGVIRKDSGPLGNFKPLRGAAYGPLDGMAVHPWIARTVDNALRASDPNVLARAYSGIRAGIYASWLANPATTAANLGGNLLNSMLFGDNPIHTLASWTETMRYVQAHGGFKSVPEFSDMGELFQTGLAHETLARNMKLSKEVASGISSETMMAKLNTISTALGDAYKATLQRPTRIFGRFGDAPGMKQLGSAIGLDAFEYVENIAKLAKYRQVLKDTGDAALAYRKAQWVVFDYASQPVIIQMVRDTGFIPFPGFTAFAMGRQITAALNRPGVLAAADRLGPAIWNATTLDEEQKRAIWANMADWQRQGGFVPVRVNNEEQRASLFPIKQIFPTNPIEMFGQFVEQGASGGFNAPLFDIINAINNAGAAGPSAQFGQRVYAPDAGFLERLQQTTQFIYNSYAPALARKLYKFGAPGKEASGLVPSIMKLATPVSGELGRKLQQLNELRTTNLNKDWFEQVMSVALRSTHPVSFNPAYSKTVRGTRPEDYRRQEIMQAKQKRLNEVPFDPNLTEDQKAEEMKTLIMDLIKLQLAPMGQISDALGGPVSGP